MPTPVPVTTPNPTAAARGAGPSLPTDAGIAQAFTALLATLLPNGAPITTLPRGAAQDVVPAKDGEVAKGKPAPATTDNGKKPRVGARVETPSDLAAQPTGNGPDVTSTAGDLPPPALPATPAAVPGPLPGPLVPDPAATEPPTVGAVPVGAAGVGPSGIGDTTGAGAARPAAPHPNEPAVAAKDTNAAHPATTAAPTDTTAKEPVPPAVTPLTAAATAQLLPVAAPVAPAPHVAPPPTSAASADAPPPAEQLAPVLVSVANAPPGTSHMSLQLRPDALGTVHIQVDRTPDAPTQIRIEVSRPETLALLQRDTTQLQHALDRAGVSHETMTVTLHAAPEVAPVASAQDSGQTSTQYMGTGQPHQGFADSRGRQQPSAPFSAVAMTEETSPTTDRSAHAGIDITA
jgi:Flagellar hook-length control protein FliK